MIEFYTGEQLLFISAPSLLMGDYSAINFRRDTFDYEQSR